MEGGGGVRSTIYVACQQAFNLILNLTPKHPSSFLATLMSKTRGQLHNALCPEHKAFSSCCCTSSSCCCKPSALAYPAILHICNIFMHSLSIGFDLWLSFEFLKQSKTELKRGRGRVKGRDGERERECKRSLKRDLNAVIYICKNGFLYFLLY